MNLWNIRFLLITTAFSILLQFAANAQKLSSGDFGFRLMSFYFRGEPVEVLIKSKQTEEAVKKPVLFFIQGSLPSPLIKYDEKGAYNVFPFDSSLFLDKYHLIIVSKPGIPLVVPVKMLDKSMSYIDPATKQYPAAYLKNDFLSFYTERNKEVINFLNKQPWVEKGKTVILGHSAGSTVALATSLRTKGISRLVYAAGNPAGRIVSMLAQSRIENDSLAFNEAIEYWKDIQQEKLTTLSINRADIEFSKDFYDDLLSLKIPVLVVYGNRDFSAPFNDLLHIKTIRADKKNFSFITYPGLEHNFFKIRPNGKIDEHSYNWDSIARDIFTWLK